MKKIGICGIAFVALMLCSSIVFAATLSSIKVPMATKDPTTWKQISAKGVVVFGYTGDTRFGPGYQFVQFSQSKSLKPVIDYTLIYYGYSGINDVWPYATCISTAKTDSLGIFPNHQLKGEFNWMPMINDGVAQKFWVVPSKDINCEAHAFVAWNPSSYLFEQKTI